MVRQLVCNAVRAPRVQVDSFIVLLENDALVLHNLAWLVEVNRQECLDCFLVEHLI